MKVAQPITAAGLLIRKEKHVELFDKTMLSDLRGSRETFRVPAAPKPTTWFRRRGEGEPAALVRQERAPRYPRATAANPHAIRVEMGDVAPGDRFGAWTVTELTFRVRDHHDPGCLSTFGDRPEPCAMRCTGWYRLWTVICTCDCGTVKTVEPGHLVTAGSLSCGHCRCSLNSCDSLRRYAALAEMRRAR